ncbi:bacteriohemerythrin [Rhodoferax sp.]|uniref:bacteriohemerythrin n=1 Tax=Rhodoferax sp. TaxID=50421 RepID=UPI002638C231|nr:bacteriohemerythrin [Rhodoferax sp.]MDD2924504.1 bacteriohemerythrin [Rhodoferax sp.]
MAYFEWGVDLVIDNGPIDEDHKVLVSLVNELHTATSQGQGHDMVENLLQRLVSHTRDHLQREEHIMSAAQFPQLTEHLVGHNDFMDKLLELQEKYRAGSITVAPQLSALLRDWLSIHIRRYDRELLVFMKKSQKAQQATQRSQRRPSQPKPGR